MRSRVATNRSLTAINLYGLTVLGKSTYIDRPEAIPSPPKMSNKLKEKVAGHYNAEAYEPRRAESPAVTKTAQSPPK